MRVILQRVSHARVTVAEETVGEIARGLVVLAGVTGSDGAADAEFLANKIANLRIFEDEAGKFNLSALDTHAEILLISQFTLYADSRRGRRPDFISAARPEQAEPLINLLGERLRATGLPVATGRFGARMLVEIFNDGPVTILLDSADR